MSDSKFEIVHEELPEELKAELRESRTHDLESRLAQMFDDGQARTINETLIDYWHAHKTVVKRATMTQTLATMAKNGKAVRRAGKGVYISNKAGQPVPAAPRYLTPEHMWSEELNKATCDRNPTLGNGVSS